MWFAKMDETHENTILLLTASVLVLNNFFFISTNIMIEN